ncbi:MAG: hypothetical protein AAF583_01455 [Pseudomonadota bacterium]
MTDTAELIAKAKAAVEVCRKSIAVNGHPKNFAQFLSRCLSDTGSYRPHEAASAISQLDKIGQLIDLYPDVLDHLTALQEENQRKAKRIAELEAENERLREALTDIAHGNLGTKDPAGDGNTYILDGSEGLRFKEIARQALAGEDQ